MSAGQMLKQANQLKRAGRLDEAIALYRQAIEVNPNFAWTYYELGDALTKNGQPDDVVIVYQSAIDTNKKSPCFSHSLEELVRQAAKSRDGQNLASLSVKRHHTIISGTGRAGTTFLVQLLTELELDTGFKDTVSNVFKNCNAGMEKDIRSEDAPYIIKNPWLCDYIEEVMESQKLVIDTAYIPIRDLYSASASRIYVTQNTDAAQYSNFKDIPGGLWHTTTPSMQPNILQNELYKLLYQLAKYDVSTVFLFFPRFVKDPSYLYKKLKFLLKEISYDRFLVGFKKIVKPELVHEFEGDIERPKLKSQSVTSVVGE